VVSFGGLHSPPLGQDHTFESCRGAGKARADCGGAQIAALQRFSSSGNKKPSSPRLYRGSSRWLALASLRSNTQRAVNPESKKQPIADLLSLRSRRLRRGRCPDARFLLNPRHISEDLPHNPLVSAPRLHSRLSQSNRSLAAHWAGEHVTPR
jgi:hypothetical protein